MTIAPIQERLKLALPRQLKPLVDLQGAAGLAGDDTDESDILDDLQRGPRDLLRIDWAWNIAGKDAISREVRVLALCLTNRAARFGFEDALYSIFPEQRSKLFRKPTLAATFLARRLSCTAPHTLNLIADKLLLAVPKTRRAGRNGSPAVLWSSVVKFFEERRIL